MKKLLFVALLALTLVGFTFAIYVEGEDTTVSSGSGDMTVTAVPTLLAQPVVTSGTGMEETAPVACTMDAKMCPDGSFVGRTGPNCEFVCPTEEVKKPLMCTREYNPVCGIDGNVYSNSCMAGDVEIDYMGQCVAYTPSEKEINVLDKVTDKLEEVAEEEGEEYIVELLSQIYKRVMKSDNLKHKYYIQKLMTPFN